MMFLFASWLFFYCFIFLRPSSFGFTLDIPGSSSSAFFSWLEGTSTGQTRQHG